MTSERDSESALTTGEEFDEALDRAELLLRGIQEMRLAVARIRLGQFSVAAGGALAGGLLAAAGVVADVIAVGGFLTVLTGILVGALLSFLRVFLVGPLLPRIRRDERTMIELVDTLRELFPHLSRREQWSDLRRYLVRTRLEQFPVGAKDVTR
ncbi:hypothetical protein ACQP2E_11450 [Actinoplanes sp. CA-015351]|uniref:hypothetical protein n=1 Tax=Actinoplanes sp. CA-015351 TaxID=3239897 RepID=UPI003D96467F